VPAAAELKPGSTISAGILDQPFAPAGGVHSYAALCQPVGNLPEGVDPRKREQYLSDEEFESVLGTTRPAFGALKAWRQIELKRKARLF